MPETAIGVSFAFLICTYFRVQKSYPRSLAEIIFAPIFTQKNLIPICILKQKFSTVVSRLSFFLFVCL